MNPITFVIVNGAYRHFIWWSIKVDRNVVKRGCHRLLNYMSNSSGACKLAILSLMTKSVASGCIDNILSMEQDMVEGTQDVHPDSDVAVAFKDVALTYQGDQMQRQSYLLYCVKRRTIGVIGDW